MPVLVGVLSLLPRWERPFRSLRKDCLKDFLKDFFLDMAESPVANKSGNEKHNHKILVIYRRAKLCQDIVYKTAN